MHVHVCQVDKLSKLHMHKYMHVVFSIVITCNMYYNMYGGGM